MIPQAPLYSNDTTMVQRRGLLKRLTTVLAEFHAGEVSRDGMIRSMGEMLCELKSISQHGDFLASLKVLKIDPRNAQRWMGTYRASIGKAKEPLKCDTVSHLRGRHAKTDNACQHDETQGFVEIRRRAAAEDEPGQEPMSDAERAAWLGDAEDDEEDRSDLADAGLVLDGEGMEVGNGEVGAGGGASSPLEQGRDARDGAHAHQTGPNASRVARDEPARALHARAAIVAPLHVARPASTPLSERGDTHTQMTLDREYQAAEGLRRLTAMVEAGRLNDGELAEVETLVARICRKAVAP